MSVSTSEDGTCGRVLTKMPTIILFPVSCLWVVPYHSDSQLVMGLALANRIIMITIKIETQKVLVCWDLLFLLVTLKTIYWDHAQASWRMAGIWLFHPIAHLTLIHLLSQVRRALQRPSSPGQPEETLRNYTHFCYLARKLGMAQYSAKVKELVPHSKARETQWYIPRQWPWLGNTVLITILDIIIKYYLARIRNLLYVFWIMNISSS